MQRNSMTLSWFFFMKNTCLVENGYKNDKSVDGNVINNDIDYGNVAAVEIVSS